MVNHRQGELSIAQARPQDMDLIFQLIKALADYEKRPEDMTAKKADLYHLIFESKDAEVLLAYLDQEAVGFVLFYPVVSTFSGRRYFYIEDLFVKAEKRGQGIGRALIEALKMREGSAGVKFTCLTNNHSALLFYQRLGAEAGPEALPFYLKRGD